MADEIRVRACMAVVQDDKILLVPHFNTDVAPVQWCIPGGRVEFGESVFQAAVREFLEETGFHAEITCPLDVSEVVLPDKPSHSISITFSGKIIGGKLLPEADNPFGTKIPQWFSAHDLHRLHCHPRTTIERALGISL